ncbi:uncharacterized protein jing isoform X2 [Panulirus ornatus]|uniref:uncharacterized protein jing isoform X2 n=1 Tax=Panulirus ornatus TaxID=150431 RepID=UPI003A8A7EB5
MDEGGLRRRKRGTLAKVVVRCRPDGEVQTPSGKGKDEVTTRDGRVWRSDAVGDDGMGSEGDGEGVERRRLIAKRRKREGMVVVEGRKEEEESVGDSPGWWREEREAGGGDARSTAGGAARTRRTRTQTRAPADGGGGPGPTLTPPHKEEKRRRKGNATGDTVTRSAQRTAGGRNRTRGSGRRSFAKQNGDDCEASPYRHHAPRPSPYTAVCGTATTHCWRDTWGHADPRQTRLTKTRCRRRVYSQPNPSHSCASVAVGGAQETGPRTKTTSSQTGDAAVGDDGRGTPTTSLEKIATAYEEGAVETAAAPQEELVRKAPAASSSAKPLKGICRLPGVPSTGGRGKKRVRFGVGGEWIASSPCSSLTSSPPPRPEELDECCPGSAHPTPTPTPTAGARCTTPPPPAADNEHLLTCMAPNDGSGVRVGRKGGHDGDQLMGRFGPGGQMGHTPHKDRPPDTISLPVRATRRTAPHDAAHRRRRVQAAHARKRSGEEEEEVGMGAERRTKLPRASPPPSPLNGVRRLNGCVNGGGEAADLLERLAGLPEASEKGGRPAHPAHRNNGLSKDSLQNGVGHLLGKNGIKCYNGSVNGRVNGAVRPDRQDPQFNNNIEPTSLPPSPAKLSHSDALPHTRAHAPTAAKRATQGIPHPTQGITLSCDVGLTPPLPSPRAAHQPPASPTAARCSANSSPPPAHTSPCNSKSRSSSASSGVGSSAPSSGTSTPTPTVRFPPPEKKEAADVCRWRECNLTLDPASSLLEHIQAVHVEGQLEAESFRCLWVGCKVYDKASCSVSWLERHVLTHGGHKPFKCIVDGCGQRFTSQTALGRHVNHHFSTTTTVPSPRPPAQPSPSKLIRKNGRKCRYRKKPWSDVIPAARMFDMFDVGVMECVRWRLMCVTQIQNGGSGQASDQTFTLRPQVLARRTCSKGIKEVLVRWSPPGVLADEWVAMDQLEATQNVPLEQLSPEAKQTVTQLCYPSLARPQKHRRKRPSCPKSLSLDIFKAV